MDAGWNVLKWVLVVLAGGFVGYIGRFGAQWLIERARARRQVAQEGRSELPPAGRPQDSARDSREAQKAEKKLAKALVKAAKKRAKNKN